MILLYYGNDITVFKMFNMLYYCKYIENDYSDTTAIFPAAGVGSRMNSSIPKQYYIIGNKTILEHSMRHLLHQSCIKHCIVVIDAHDRWFYQLSISNHPKVSAVIGGKTRADSVMAGLRNVKESMWVIIHDAVRPCLCRDDVLRLLSIKKFSQVGGILAIPIDNTIKRIYPDTNCVNYTVHRNNLWSALTPQLFKFNILKYCLTIALKNKIIITDESSAIEYCGYASTIVWGRSNNIKVTYREDLKLAKFYLSNLYQKGGLL